MELDVRTEKLIRNVRLFVTYQTITTTRHERYPLCTSLSRLGPDQSARNGSRFDTLIMPVMTSTVNAQIHSSKVLANWPLPLYCSGPRIELSGGWDSKLIPCSSQSGEKATNESFE